MLIRRISAAAAAMILSGVTTFQAAAQTKVTIRLGHVLAESHSWHLAGKGFADEVSKATDGRVTVQVFPSGQLGSEKDVIEGLQIGTIQSGIVGSGSFQQIEPKMGIVEMPYAWPTREKAFAAFDGELGVELSKLVAAKNIVVLAWWENGYRHITTKKTLIAKPEDLKGVKIRVTPDKVRLDTFRALGAEPAPLAFGELYSALQQGVFDAQENPLSIIYSASFADVQKHVALTGHVWGAACLVVSKRVWEQIAPADQAIVQAAAAKWRDEQRKMISSSDQDLVAKLTEKGMTVSKVDPTPFIAAVKPVWASQEAVFGPALLQLLEKYRK